MEMVTIEKKTFELWRRMFENFTRRVDALGGSMTNGWITAEPVACRTFQPGRCRRDMGKLPYLQINGKIYYKASDQEAFLLDQVRKYSKK